jgi:hypothetical protein
LAYLDGENNAPLQPLPIPFLAPHFNSRITGFGGFEAIGLQGQRVFLTIESGGTQAMQGYLVAGDLAQDLSKLELEVDNLVEIPAQINLWNLAEESLVVVGDKLLTIHEANGLNINPEPVVHLFDLGLHPQGTLPISSLEYRITDATSVDAEDRFWVINYFYPGEREKLNPAADLCVAKFGQGATHAQSPAVERLVEFKFTEQGVVQTDTPPIQLQLLTGETWRNWEGIVRLEQRGFLIMTDQYPETMLGFVPLPD